MLLPILIPILVKFDIHFLGLPWEIFFSVAADDLITPLAIALEKCKKEICNILVQDFCPLKIEITQFRDGFRVNNLDVSLMLWSYIFLFSSPYKVHFFRVL